MLRTGRRGASRVSAARAVGTHSPRAGWDIWREDGGEVGHSGDTEGWAKPGRRVSRWQWTRKTRAPGASRPLSPPSPPPAGAAPTAGLCPTPPGAAAATRRSPARRAPRALQPIAAAALFKATRS